MRYTIQISLDPCYYSTPNGTEDIEHVSSIQEAKDSFWRQADGDHIGSSRAASALLWRGTLDDTTDIYPDLELTLGPRGGVRVSRL